MRKLTTFGLFAAASLAFLLAPDTAFAQRWRGAGPRLEGQGLDIGGGYRGSSYYGSPYYGAQYPTGNQYTSMYFSGDMDTARAENRVMLNVQAPPGANLWISDVFIGGSDRGQQFISPPLQAGRNYIYDVKARWMQDGREMSSTRSVQFQGGAQSNLSFDLTSGQPVSTQPTQGTQQPERTVPPTPATPPEPGASPPNTDRTSNPK